MFLALQRCNLHRNILCYCSSCKVVSSHSLKSTIQASVGMVSIFPARTRLLFPPFPHSVSLTWLYFSGEDFYCSAFTSSRGCIGRSELMRGWFLVRVTQKKRPKFWIRSFPFPLAFSGSKHPSGVGAWHWWYPFWWLLTWCGCHDYCSPADVHGTWNGSEI